ncbi:MAG: hypothetical protein F6J90_16255 [Moorea sp. SIOASIH]|uniref:hypothetical protein n=1 Tax=Moorena sp. SIOASIH TaxID=2607817 RepID=UPI0013BCB5A6|nr:hypothetical protein [Moorena sp. SIOASIH]NEO37795.1 hypothetical protein [Moorena sp. SIOASIH]
MGEIFIKGNCHNMILAFYCRRVFLQKRCRGATRDGEQSLDRRSRYANAITENAPLRSWGGRGATRDGEQSLDRRSRYANAITENAPLRSWGFPRGKQRCGRRFRTQPLPMSDCRGSPHERLDQDSEMHPVFGVWLMVNE